MAFKFKGGVHPDYRKHPEVPVTVIAPPKQVVIPMAQHIGAPCTPLVKKGDTVKMYQKIGDTQAPVSAPVHASVSGTVVAVEPRPHPLGDLVMSVVIENDGLDEEVEKKAKHGKHAGADRSLDELLERAEKDFDDDSAAGRYLACGNHVGDAIGTKSFGVIVMQIDGRM